MNPVIAIVTAIVAAVIGTGTVATAIATAIVQIGVALALSALARLFAPGVPKPASVQTPKKQSRPVRQSAFGRVRVSGPYMLYEAANQTLYDVIALLDGRSHAIVGHYLNDDAVTLTGGGGVISPDGKKYSYGTPGDRVQILTRLGLSTETPYAEVVAGLPGHWTLDHRGDGVTSLAMIAKQSKPQFQQEDFPNGEPLPGVVVEAQLCRDPRGDAIAFTRNPVLELAAYLTTAAGGMGLSWDRRIAPAIDSWREAADDCEAGIAIVAQHGVITDDPQVNLGATVIHLSNVAGIGAGTVLAFSDEVKTVDHVAGLAVTLTAGLALAHLKGSAVNWTPTYGTITEERYRCDGVYNHDTPPADVIGQLLASFDGWMSQRGDGALVIRAGKYVEPSITLTDEMIVGYSLQHFQDDADAVNELLVSYTDPNAAYQQGDAGAWTDEADIAARGVTRSAPFDLPWVPSTSQARRLAKRQMARLTAELRGTITTNLAGMNALGQRYLAVQCSENAAIADIVIEVTKVAVDLSSMTLAFEFIQASPLIDEWTAAEETPGNEVNTRPSPAALDAPTIDSHVVVFEGNQARVQLVVTAPLVDVNWQVRWRRAGDSAWNETSFTDIDDGPGVDLFTGLVSADADLEFQTAYQTPAQRSPWSATEAVDTHSDGVVPDDAATITVTGWGSSISLITDPIPRARNYRWKVYGVDSPATLLRTTDTASPQWAYTNAIALGDGIARDYIITVEGVNLAGSGAYASTGHISKPAPAAVTLGSITGGATATVPYTTSGEPDIAGAVIYWFDTPGFDPITEGTPVPIGTSPFVLSSLPIATHYLRVAAFDSWTSYPPLLNFAGEASVVITSVSTSPPGGEGGAGGGYDHSPPNYHGGNVHSEIP